ncbi:MAG: hypothetical protein ACLRZ2_01355 [Veillonella sp.]
MPFDPLAIVSGIRLVHQLTTRGLQVKDMEEIADIIATVLKNPEDKSTTKKQANVWQHFVKRILY